MGHVVIGMDPHKRSATIEIADDRQKVLFAGRFGTDRDGYKQMLAAGRKFKDRTWAVEGCNGIGRHIAQRLVADGEPVVDVPAKLSARARVFSTGQGRKTDPVDAHSVALVGLHSTGLRVITAADATVALRLLAGRRDEPGVARSQTINRIHRLLLELLPGGAKKFLSAAQARELLAGVRPRDIAGKTRRRLAAQLITEFTQTDKRIKAADTELKQLVTGSSLLTVHGIGPPGAARLLGDVGDIARFADKGRFASWNGTAPLDASSGDQNRHRLSRAGNRRINRVLHIMAIVALRNDTEGRACYRRKLATGKTSMEALRCLKRRLSDVVCNQMRADAKRAQTGPGGHAGRLFNPARLTQSPRSALRSSHFPDPPDTSLEPSPSPRLDTEGSHDRTFIPEETLHGYAVGPFVRWAMTGPPAIRGTLDNRAPSRRYGRLPIPGLPLWWPCITGCSVGSWGC
jgi:transposase